ncbi:MAG: hypothetical protein FJX73_06855 [Armatimonadetes bacterium]|nr:hypothetical protein [Armatimonadota bacterium]
MRTIMKVLALVLVGTLTFVVGASAAPKLVVKGDAKVWAEVSAAMTKLAKLKSYRSRGTIAGPTGPMVTMMDVVNPDSYHAKMTVGGNTIETIQVGTAVRMRTGGGPWMCQSQPREQAILDPGQMWGEVAATRGPEETIAGVRTQSYTYVWKNDVMTVKTRLFVATADGLPRRAQVLGDDGAVTMTTDYYDFNAAIKITLPSCK